MSFSIRAVLLLLLSLSSTAKTFGQDAPFRGHDVGGGGGEESPISTEHEGGRSYAHGLPPSDARDRLDAVDLLGILTKAGERGLGEERGGSLGEKQRRLNRRALRVWNRRNSGSGSSLFREDEEGPSDSPVGPSSRVPSLPSLVKEQSNGGRRAENDGASSTSSNGGTFRYGETVFPFDDISSFLSEDSNNDGEALSDTANGFHLAAATMARLRELDEKRKWERNSLRVWGKRNVESDDLKELPTYPNMRRRKWENLPLRVWGK